MDKILTVSIAAYNVENFIEQCLKPFANHTFDNVLEVLIIDDGGTDDTVKIAQKYESFYPRIFKVVHKENGGWGSTVNYGIENAHGKYFKQLDGDDHYNIKFIGRFLEFLSNSDADIVYTPFDVFENESDRFIYHEQEKLFELYTIYNLNDIDRIALRMHTLTFKTSNLRQNKIKLLEKCFYTDVELVIKALYSSKTIEFTDIPVYCYRVGRTEQSVSFSSMIKHYKEHEMVLFQLIDVYKEHMGDKKNNFIAHRIRQMVDVNYEILVHMKPTSENKKRMVLFDKKLSHFEDFYDVSNKKIVVMRKTKFRTYLPLLIYARLKKNKAEQVY